MTQIIIIINKNNKDGKNVQGKKHLINKRERYMQRMENEIAWVKGG